MEHKSRRRVGKSPNNCFTSVHHIQYLHLNQRLPVLRRLPCCFIVVILKRLSASATFRSVSCCTAILRTADDSSGCSETNCCRPETLARRRTVPTLPPPEGGGAAAADAPTGGASEGAAAEALTPALQIGRGLCCRCACASPPADAADCMWGAGGGASRLTRPRLSPGPFTAMTKHWGEDGRSEQSSTAAGRWRASPKGLPLSVRSAACSSRPESPAGGLHKRQAWVNHFCHHLYKEYEEAFNIA